MKKIVLSTALAMVIGLAGCATGGGKLTTPIKNRAQDIDPAVMTKVYNEAPKAFDEGIKRLKSSQRYTFTELEKVDKKLYDLFLPLLTEAQKMYKERNLPKDILQNGPQWLLGDFSKLNITLAKSEKGRRFNGQYSPFDNILLVDYDESVDKNLLIFLLGHEIGHAISLHVSEDKTNEEKALKGAEDAAALALDVALNKLYAALDKSVAGKLDSAAKMLQGQIFTKEDVEKDEKIVSNRANSFVAKAAIAVNQTDKLKLMGIGLEIPVQTKLALKGLISNGMAQTEALDALKGGVKFVNTQVVVMGGHTKEQEKEADVIGLELAKRAGFDVLATACERFKGNKQAGIFDNHPSYDVRRENLGCPK